MSENNNVKMKVWEYGSGAPCVIFLHGFPLDHTIWEPLVPFLQDRARLILPDLRGHGATPVAGEISIMQDMADDVIGLMDDLSLKKAVVVGHSMGGYISFAIAKRYPERLLGLGLVATHPLADDESKKKSRLESAVILEKNGLEAIASGMPENLTADRNLQALIRQIILRNNAPGAAAAQRGMAAREDSEGMLGSILVPAVVVAGEDDQIVPLPVAESMAGKLPYGKLVTIPDSGHMPMMEAPALTARALSELLDRV